jgi:hypothetical protein
MFCVEVKLCLFGCSLTDATGCVKMVVCDVRFYLFPTVPSLFTSPTRLRL